MRLARLADNQIGDEGAAALAAALPQMASLTTLDLFCMSTPAALLFRLWGLGHGLLSAVVRAVCLGVRAHGRLWAAGGRVGGAVRLARLADNQIGDEGAAALAAALPQMASLTTLHLFCMSTPAALLFRLWGLGIISFRR